MKVEITGLATLEITPENGLENYALKKWFEDYNSSDTSKRMEAVLRVSFKREGFDTK